MNFLVIGGSKSGKSMYSQNLARDLKKNNIGDLYYIATMKPCDDEDLIRIENHIKDREGYNFKTIEQSYNIADVSKKIGENDIVLLDSITALLCNEMFSKDGCKNKLNVDPCDYICDGINLIFKKAKHTIIVSDYIFSDAIVFDEETKEYIKFLALINKKLGRECEVVCECNYSNIKYHKDLRK